MRVLVTNDREWINWVLMTVLSKTALLNWLWSIPPIHNRIDRIFLCSNVPFQQIPCHCCTNDDIRVVRIEYCFGHFVLTIQSELWSTLHAETEDIYPSIWGVEVPFSTFTVTCKEQLGLRWRPINACYCPIEKLIFLECELLCKLTFFILDITFFFVVFSKEVIHDIELLTKSSFHQSSAVFEKLFKLFTGYNLLNFIFWQLLYFDFLLFLLLFARLEIYLHETCFRSRWRFPASSIGLVFPQMLLHSRIEFIIPLPIFSNNI